MATRRAQRGWWSAIPLPLRIGSEVLAGYMVATTLAKILGPVFAGFEVVVIALVAAGVAHGLGKLSMIDDVPALRAFFDWYAPPVGQNIRAPWPGRRAEPLPESVDPPPPPPLPPDISGFVAIDDILRCLQEFERSQWIRGKSPMSGTLVLISGPSGSGKSSIAHAWAAGLGKRGVRNSKKFSMLLKQTIPDLRAHRQDLSGSIRRLAESSLNGVLLIDDLDTLVAPSERSNEREVGEVFGEVAERHPNQLLIVASGSEDVLNRIDAERRWLNRFHVEKVELSPFSDEALYEIFASILRKYGKRVEADAQITFNNRLRELRRRNFENARTAIALAARALVVAADRPTVTKDDIRNLSPV